MEAAGRGAEGEKREEGRQGGYDTVPELLGTAATGQRDEEKGAAVSRLSCVTGDVAGV